jgi:integrase
MRNPRCRALILLATFTSLRWGEAIALRRYDIDREAGTVSIQRQYIELGTGHAIGPPKSRAGFRIVAIPARVT